MRAVRQWKRAVKDKKETLYDNLVTYCGSGHYPYHMPGHKRKSNTAGLADAFGIDITEIDGFDNLHQAEGVIKQAQERAAALYGADETFFLVNGSTCGILAAVTAATEKGDTVIMARNCHKSVYHAVFLQELRTVYLYPGQITEYDIADAIVPADVEAALENCPECSAVIITSPTYEGIVSDIGKIGRIVHEKGKILIVDEAHGAHFGLAGGMPENAVRQGADIVIHSLHKTLPSMTQTALLHVRGSLVNRRKLRAYLRIFQSSSPSYVLMASMDACIAYLQDNAEDCFAGMKQNYDFFMNRTDGCRHIRIGRTENIINGNYAFTAWDIGKLLISVKDASVSGQALYDLLREDFHLQMEMAAESYVLAIMTIADTRESWQRLADALLEIDDRIINEEIIENKAAEGQGRDRIDSSESGPEEKPYGHPAVRMTIAEALHRVYEDTAAEPRAVLLEEAAGESAGEFINLYPPGIPLLVPGEVIEEGMILQIQKYRKSGLQIQGISSEGKVIVC